jgi:hypothetical protein
MAGGPRLGRPSSSSTCGKLWRRETSLTSEGKMPISFSMIVLGTAYADNAGVIGLLASILVWVGSFAANL